MVQTKVMEVISVFHKLMSSVYEFELETLPFFFFRFFRWIGFEGVSVISFGLRFVVRVRLSSLGLYFCCCC